MSRLGLVTHQVEPETVDLVIHRPGHHGVDQQLAHHGVLGGGVGAAGGSLHRSRRREPLVIAGNHPIQYRLRVLPGRRGVVVDHVHDHPQTGCSATAPSAGTRGCARARSGSSRTSPPAPCSATGRSPSCNRRWPADAAMQACCCSPAGSAAVNAGRSQAGVVWSALIFGNGGDVERGQQVDGVQAGGRQRLQVLHPVRVRVGERQVPHRDARPAPWCPRSRSRGCAARRWSSPPAAPTSACAGTTSRTESVKRRPGRRPPTGPSSSSGQQHTGR